MTDDEERERILREARRTIERTRDVAPDVALPPLEDPVQRWRREADERQRARAAAKAEIAAQSGRALNLVEIEAASRPAIDLNMIDARIQQAVEREREVLIEVLGELFAEERDRVGKLFKELQASTDRMTGQLEKLREWHLADDRSRSTVIDMPSPLRPLRDVN